MKASDDVAADYGYWFALAGAGAVSGCGVAGGLVGAVHFGSVSEWAAD